MFMLSRASRKYCKQMHVTPLPSMTDALSTAAIMLVVIIIVLQPLHSNLCNDQLVHDDYDV